MEPHQKTPRPAPLSIRLSPAERERLERDARGLSLSAYVKDRIFDDAAPARRTRGKAPVKDHQALAQLLALWGASGMSRHLDDLANAANAGALDMSPETEELIVQACAEVFAMRGLLLKALGLKESS